MRKISEEKNQSVRGKPPAVPILCAAVIIALGLLFIGSCWIRQKNAVEEYALGAAQSAEAFLLYDLIAALQADPSDIEKPEYNWIKESLIRFKDRNADVVFSYLLGVEDGKIVFLVDSEAPDSADYSPPGQEYANPNPEEIERIARGEPMICGPLRDQWGRWISVTVPIKNPGTGRVVAAFGVDYDANTWYTRIFLSMLGGVFALLSVLLIFIAFYWAITGKKQILTIQRRLQSNERFFQNVFEQLPIGIAVINDFRFVSDINPKFEAIMARSKEELAKTDWKDITHPDDLGKDLEMFQRFKAGEIDGYTMVKRFLLPDGRASWIKMTIAALKNGPEKGGMHLCIIEDINEFTKAEQALRDSERSKAVLLSNLPGMAFRRACGPEGAMQFVSEGCFELTGYKPDELIKNRRASYGALINPEYREGLRRARAGARHHYRFEYPIVTAAGERKWVYELGQAMPGEDGAPVAIEGMIIDITDKKEREEQVVYLSEHDHMTGLYNRKYFDEAIKRIDIGGAVPVSVIVGNINGVRLINDAFGQSEGDRLITETAQILQNCCREGDIPARTGGDEFSVLLPGTDRDTAYEMLKKIRSACETYNITAANEIYYFNMSLGFGTKETTEQNIAKAAKEAESYMRKRKLLDQKSSHSAILSSIMAALYARSLETKEHAVRLSDLSRRIGRELKLSQSSLDELELFAMLHDIGKVGIDDRILKKAGQLTQDEWTLMKKHPEIGCSIAISSPELQHIAEYILSHHERWDGLGYPQGLKGEEIPLLSRILAIADAYDAMTQDRVYRKAVTQSEALEEISMNAGTQFDPFIVPVFIKILRESG